MHSYPRPLAFVIQELAQENADLQWPQDIDQKDAREAINLDVLAAFWTVQRANNDAHETMCDIVERLDDVAFHTAIAAKHPLALTMFHDAMMEHVTAWLQQEAREYQTEHNMVGDPYEEPYDPTRADRIALAREVNAGNAARRMQR